MIASSIGICNNKSEIVQAILISTLSFYIAQKNSIGMIKKQLDNSNYENNIKLINEYLLEEISKIDAKKMGRIAIRNANRRSSILLRYPL